MSKFRTKMKNSYNQELSVSENNEGWCLRGVVDTTTNCSRCLPLAIDVANGGKSDQTASSTTSENKTKISGQIASKLNFDILTSVYVFEVFVYMVWNTIKHNQSILKFTPLVYIAFPTHSLVGMPRLSMLNENSDGNGLDNYGSWYCSNKTFYPLWIEDIGMIQN